MREIYVRQVTVIDYARLDGEKGLVGESDIVDVAIRGDLNCESMIFDFGLVKRQIKALLDEQIDHRLLVPTAHPNVRYREESGEREVTLHLNQRRLHYVAPSSAIAPFDVEEIDSAILTHHCEVLIQAALPKNVTGVRVTLRRETMPGTFFTYSHGLRDHDGNCQRLIHGHLSRLEIEIDQQSRPDIEKVWADQLNHRYIGRESDCIAVEGDGEERVYFFEYHTSQGRFHLEVPALHCYIIPTRTTVEKMADHLLSKLQPQHPNSEIQISLDEGLGKGVRVTHSNEPSPQ